MVVKPITSPLSKYEKASFWDEKMVNDRRTNLKQGEKKLIRVIYPQFMTL